MADLGQPKQYGVTAPISTLGPKPETKAITKALLEELQRRGQFESEAEARQREVVLGRLNLLVKEFVRRVCERKSIPPSAARDAGGKIFTFGSYRLGVHGPGADIDTLCVVPRMVDRSDFFTIFEEQLRAENDVEELHSVPEAYVPVIKMKFAGIEIDLLFARMALASIPDDLQLRDDTLLKNLEEPCVRSLGGSRVTDEILRLVPNVQVFRDALRAIKLWAKQRAIYSNVVGFLGGVAWAMLVARVCQLYPNEIAGGIVSRFFLIMLKWKWPQPVVLKPIEDGPLQVRVWNPKIYPADKAHRMPIITPAYPSMNSTHNVSYSTQEIMLREFSTAAGIVDRISVGQAQWSDFFLPHDFFTRYRYYLQICASAGDADTQIKWAGTVESRLRLLVMKLETVENLQIAHPYVKGFDRMYYCLDNAESVKLASGEVPPEVARRTREDVEGVPDVITAHLTFFYIGLQIDQPPKAAGSGPKKLDISYPISEFQRMAKMWDSYDTNTMGLIVRYLKNAALPDFVFENGERVAAKPGKRTVKQAANGQDPDIPPTKKMKQFMPEPLPGQFSPAGPATPSEQAAVALTALTTSTSPPPDGAPQRQELVGLAAA